LRLYVHVIRRSNGTGGQSSSSVNQALSFLAADFNPHGISFDWNGNIDYIDDDSHYSTPKVAIYSVNNHEDGIDVYMYDDASGAGGRANGVGGSSEYWISGSYWKEPKISLVTSHVASHEMGHVLFLWHTHHGTINEGGDPGQCAELVNGSNGDTCGDYISDTPADPHLRFNVNHPACEWTGSGTDANGDSYNPDETLIMSYTNPSCMSYFSPLQGQRMRNAIATLAFLQKTVVECENCPENVNVTKNVSGGQTDIQKANNTLTASNIIENNGTAKYSAGKKVILKPGFHAKGGSKFNAKIEACNANNARLASGANPSKLSEKLENKKVFNIYPIPTNKELNIEFFDENVSEMDIAIYSANGQIIKNVTLSNNRSTIDVSELSNGLYYIKLLNDGAVIETQKVLISK